MDILNVSIKWTKAEMLSSSFFILFGLMFVIASIWMLQTGKSEMARAYILPMAVAGVLMLIIGIGLFVPSYLRITGFATEFAMDAPGFVAGEILRADRVIRDYQIAVFRVMPAVIAVCAVLIVILDGPVWRAIFVTVIAMMTITMIIDTNSHARLETYREALGTSSDPD